LTGRYAARVRHRQAEPFWQKTSAIIVAIGTLISSLVALFGLLVAQKWFGPSPDDFYTPAEGASPVPLDKTVLWGPKEFRFERLMRVDLDPAGGPVRNGGEADMYMWQGAEVSNPHGIFVWQDKSEPSLRDCANFLVTHGSREYIGIQEGMRLCARTNEGRVALVVVKRRDGEAWLVDATVWKQRLS
jgi:hypothetical protein